MIIKYYTCGSESEPEGLTLAVNHYDDSGNFIAGTENIKSLYKVKEITKEEYDAYIERFKREEEFGFPASGLLNEKGKAALKKALEEERITLNNMKIARNEPKIALSVKKIKKLLQLEIIEQADVDTEIEQQGMTDFKDEIKRRLNQN